MRPTPPADQCARVLRLQAWLAAQEGGPVSCIETHISWVLLTPQHAYKLKKAVDLGFIDQRSLAARQHACEEELRLNRRTAPALYLGMVGVSESGALLSGSPTSPASRSSSPALDAADFAVCMRRFDPAQTLDRLLAATWPAPAGAASPAPTPTPTPELSAVWAARTDALIDQVVALHASAQPVRGEGLGLMSDLHAATGESPAQWRALARGAQERAQLQRTIAWLQAQEEALAPLCRARREAGFVRELHGDLHLGNVCLFEGRVTVFDGIDFNAALRTIDTLNDLAFLLMDLHAKGASALAWRALNRYLDATGDHAGLPLLPMCMVWRALVRFKVARLKDAAGTGVEAGTGTGTELGVAGQAELALCLRLVQPPTPGLVLMHGVSGCGKTAVSQGLLGVWGAVRLRSDVERQRMASSGRYAPAQVAAVYARLHTLAEAALRAGQRVILDATHLDAAQRQAAIAIAEHLGCPWAIVHVQAPLAVMRERIQARRLAGDASEADEAVLAQQWAQHGDGWDGLSAQEQARALRCDTTLPLSHWARPEAWSGLARLGGLLGGLLG
jgi:uncharacterized protein